MVGDKIVRFLKASFKKGEETCLSLLDFLVDSDLYKVDFIAITDLFTKSDLSRKL